MLNFSHTEESYQTLLPNVLSLSLIFSLRLYNFCRLKLRVFRLYLVRFYAKGNLYLGQPQRSLILLVPTSLIPLPPTPQPLFWKLAWPSNFSRQMRFNLFKFSPVWPHWSSCSACCNYLIVSTKLWKLQIFQLIFISPYCAEIIIIWKQLLVL